MVIGFRVTSGDLGTDAMHPPRKRITNVVNTINHPRLETQRADTAVHPYAEILPSKVRDSVGQPNGAPRGGMLSGSAASRTFH